MVLSVRFLVLLAFYAFGSSPEMIEREQLAKDLYRQKQWDKVIETLNPYTDLASPSASIVLTQAYMEKADHRNAVRILSLILEKRPKDAQLLYMLGDAQGKLASQLQDPSERLKMESTSVESHRQAIRFQRNFRLPYEALLNHFLRTNTRHEARELLTEMLKVFEDKAMIYSDLCRLYALDGFLTQAEKSCLRAIRLSPKTPANYVYLAEAYFHQDNFAKAERSLILAAGKFPKDELAQYGAGQFFFVRGNLPVAKRYLTQAVASDQSSPRSQLALAKTLFDLGEASTALPHFLKACALNPAHQDEIQSAASRLRQRSENALASRYSQGAGGCQR